MEIHVKHLQCLFGIYGWQWKAMKAWWMQFESKIGSQSCDSQIYCYQRRARVDVHSVIWGASSNLALWFEFCAKKINSDNVWRVPVLLRVRRLRYHFPIRRILGKNDSTCGRCQKRQAHLLRWGLIISGEPIKTWQALVSACEKPCETFVRCLPSSWHLTR